MASKDRHVMQLYIEEDVIGVVPNNDKKSMKTIGCEFTTVVGDLHIAKLLKMPINLFPKLKFKAITFLFNESLLESQEFRRGCRNFCKENGYFSYFATFLELPFNGCLYQVKNLIAENEKVIICSIDGENMTYRVYIRDKNYYEVEFVNYFMDIDIYNLDTFKFNAMRTLGRFKPKKIFIITSMIFTHEEKMIADTLHNALSNLYDVSVCDKGFHEISFDTSYASVLEAMDENKDSYTFEPLLDNYFVVTHGSTEIVKENRAITLPFEKKINIKVKSKNDFILLKIIDGKTIETIKLGEFIGQEVSVVFKIDNDCFHFFSIETSESQKVIEAIAKTLKISSEYKAKIVLTENHYSIAIAKSENEKSWKNIGKFPLFISFTEAKPIVGEEAKKIFEEKPSFVIYDLVKLCSLTNTSNVDPKWPFLVETNQNNKICVEFDSHEGRKIYSLSFLMALVFRDCLSRIKKEIGEKVDELQIKINFEGNNDLIKANLEKAGERLKIKINFF